MRSIACCSTEPFFEGGPPLLESKVVSTGPLFAVVGSIGRRSRRDALTTPRNGPLAQPSTCSSSSSSLPLGQSWRAAHFAPPALSSEVGSHHYIYIIIIIVPTAWSASSISRGPRRYIILLEKTSLVLVQDNSPREQHVWLYTGSRRK